MSNLKSKRPDGAADSAAADLPRRDAKRRRLAASAQEVSVLSLTEDADYKPQWDELLALPPHGSQVFIGGLPRDITEDDLHELCEPLGEIYEVRLTKDKENKGFAFVTFTDKDAAQRAVEDVQDREYKGRTLWCSLSQAKNRLFVGNVPKGLSEEELTNVIKAQGPGVVNIEMFKDQHDPNRNCGFLFVEYYNHACADYARQKLSSRDFKVDKSLLTVSWAEPMGSTDPSSAAAQVKTIYVKNLPENVSKEKIKDLFDKHREVTKIVLPPAKAGHKRDFGFVHFAERSSALKAVKGSEKYEIDGQVLEVSMAKPLSEKKPGPGGTAATPSLERSPSPPAAACPRSSPTGDGKAPSLPDQSQPGPSVPPFCGGAALSSRRCIPMGGSSSGASSYTDNPPTSRHRDQGPLIFNGGASHQQQQQTSYGSRGVNIQVLVRCRPLSKEERCLRTPVVLTFNNQRQEVSVARNIANKQNVRTFAFDKVFGPESQQQDIFNHAIVPLVSEVLDGYNCTIFAYGQTGTGKTYTMQGGGGKALNGDLPSDAGVIQRAVKHIFDNLEAQTAKYNVKVSFLELYNEEFIDLLAPEESKLSDYKSKKPMALREDSKGGFQVTKLVEELVSSADEMYRTFERGSAKRKTAETLLNKQSSRSHSIFSITIHIKEGTPEGEVIKCGKLNLVDLAGSENISRSSGDARAREAGESNKSLLALGRVITALVEHAGHIPYRDSNLTKLLRDSLGEKTKTCIIATIAPSVPYLEGTLSTLDYAYCAKDIKNKPEVNQQMMKPALNKDLYLEHPLKQELAAREKNGVYIPREQYLVDEAEKKNLYQQLEELRGLCNSQKDTLESKAKQLEELQGLCNSQKDTLESKAKQLEELQGLCNSQKDTLESKAKQLEELQGLYNSQKVLNAHLSNQLHILQLTQDTSVLQAAVGNGGDGPEESGGMIQKNHKVFSYEEIENILLKQNDDPDCPLPSNVHAINIYKKESFEDLEQYSMNGAAYFLFRLEKGSKFSRKMANTLYRWRQDKVFPRERLILKTMMYAKKCAKNKIEGKYRRMKHLHMKEYTMREGPEDLVFCEISSDKWRDGG